MGACARVRVRVRVRVCACACASACVRGGAAPSVVLRTVRRLPQACGGVDEEAFGTAVCTSRGNHEPRPSPVRSLAGLYLLVSTSTAAWTGPPVSTILEHAERTIWRKRFAIPRFPIGPNRVQPTHMGEAKECARAHASLTVCYGMPRIVSSGILYSRGVAGGRCASGGGGDEP